MTDWGLDPGSVKSATKAGAAVIDTLLKLREAWSRRKEAKRPADKRQLDKEIDELRADLEENGRGIGEGVRKKSGEPVEGHSERAGAAGRSRRPEGHLPSCEAKVVLGHENRLKALERGAPKQNRRRHHPQ
jgi:hypothetical protein